VTQLSTHEERERRSIQIQKGAWSANAAANAPRVRRLVQNLWLDEGKKTGVLVAAGPSLEQSIDEIKSLSRETHEIVAVDMALKFLLANGIVPDYVICADASDAITDTLEADVPKEVALLLCVTVKPETGKRWPGPTYWFCMASNVFDGDLGEWMQRDHLIASKVPSYLVPGGNVSSLGLSFLIGVRAAPKVLLYGHDFCWTDEHRFYCGGVRRDLAKERIRLESEAGTVFPMKDASGQRDVWTNGSLLQFARWYHERMSEFPGVIEQRTPVTILNDGGQRLWT